MMFRLMSVVGSDVVKLIWFLLVIICNQKWTVVIKGLLLPLIMVLIVIVVDGVARLSVMLVVHQMFFQLRRTLLRYCASLL